MPVYFDNTVVDNELNKPRFDEIPQKTEQVYFYSNLLFPLKFPKKLLFPVSLF